MFSASCNKAQMALIFLSPAYNGEPKELDGSPTVEVLSGDGTFSVDAHPAGFIPPDDLPVIPEGQHFVWLISGESIGKIAYKIKGDGDLGPAEHFVEEIVELDVSDVFANNLGLSQVYVTLKPTP
jgi:hypothetical protein